MILFDWIIFYSLNNCYVYCPKFQEHMFTEILSSPSFFNRNFDSPKQQSFILLFFIWFISFNWLVDVASKSKLKPQQWQWESPNCIKSYEIVLWGFFQKKTYTAIQIVSGKEAALQAWVLEWEDPWKERNGNSTPVFLPQGIPWTKVSSSWSYLG